MHILRSDNSSQWHLERSFFCNVVARRHTDRSSASGTFQTSKIVQILSALLLKPLAVIGVLQRHLSAVAARLTSAYCSLLILTVANTVEPVQPPSGSTITFSPDGALYSNAVRRQAVRTSRDLQLGALPPGLPVASQAFAEHMTFRSQVFSRQAASVQALRAVSSQPT